MRGVIIFVVRFKVARFCHCLRRVFYGMLWAGVRGVPFFCFILLPILIGLEKMSMDHFFMRNRFPNMDRGKEEKRERGKKQAGGEWDSNLATLKTLNARRSHILPPFMTLPHSVIREPLKFPSNPLGFHVCSNPIRSPA